MERSRNTVPYRLDIQGLRAIAIALVVLAHANVAGFAGGFVGVDVFFVLSGYLISGLLLREKLSTGKIRYGRFLARRLRRLLPAMLLMLVTVIVLAALLLSAYESRMQTGAFVFAATWSSNFYFALSDFDYFSALQAKDLFLHTWSLGVEEQFYIVWPGLIALALALVGAQRNPDRQKTFLLGLLATVFVVSLALCLHWANYDPLLGFYMMPARGWQFALGAIVFVCFHEFGSAQTHRDSSAISTLSNSAIAAVGILLMVGSAVLLSPNLNYPGHYALFPSIGAALVILAGSTGNSSTMIRVLASKPFVWVGDRSYSLYLWHWPVLLIGDAYGITGNALGVISLVAVALFLAAISYRLIELPFWKGKFSNAAPWHTVSVSVVAVVIAIGGAQGLRTNVFGEPQVTAILGDYSPRRDVPTIYDAGSKCDTWYSSADLEPCVIGSNGAKHTAVLLGDSIGAQWVSLLSAVYLAPDWKVTVLTKSGCAIADQEYYYKAVGGMYDICTSWRESALSYIADIRPDVVFIGSSSQYDFSAQQWTEGVESILNSLSDVASRIVLIPGTPSLSFNGPSCIESPYRFSLRLSDSRRECEEALVDDSSENVATYLSLAANKFADVHLLDLNDLVCPDRRCAAQKTDGLVVFRDARHLTETFIIAQVPEVQGRLDRLRVGPSFLEENADLASLE